MSTQRIEVCLWSYLFDEHSELAEHWRNMQSHNELLFLFEASQAMDCRIMFEIDARTPSIYTATFTTRGRKFIITATNASEIKAKVGIVAAWCKRTKELEDQWKQPGEFTI